MMHDEELAMVQSCHIICSIGWKLNFYDIARCLFGYFEAISVLNYTVFWGLLSG
jgi:hypothetical protein